TALQMACRSRSDEVCRHLVALGADVTAPAGTMGSALQNACDQGHFDLGRWLIEKGADVNVQHAWSGTPLQAACASRRGTEAAVRDFVTTLLEHGADVNACVPSSHYGSAFQAACHRGWWAVVHTLLQRGANVNTQGGQFGTALQALCASQRLTAFNTLLELLDKGADVNAQTRPDGTALQAACTSPYLSGTHRERIVKTLLDRGADVTLRGGKYGSALQGA
ncbi:ankyrin repeat-containing domain protein, partial [Microdochium trichocladiopsis]